jgi:glycosyltransferase involved in cell wall biosynthesis
MLELARGLKANGHEVTICAHSYHPGTIDPDPAEEFEIRAVTTGAYELPAGGRAAKEFAGRGMAELAALFPGDADVINVHEGPVHLAALAYKRAGGPAPVVWTRNDATQFELALLPEESWLPQVSAPHRVLRRYLARVDRDAAHAVDAIVVLDHRNRSMVERAYGREAEIIQSGAAAKFFSAPERAAARARLGIPADEFAVLGVGILIPYRRHEDLVRAVGLLSDRGRAPKLRLIGSDHLSPETGAMLREIVAAEALEQRVELIQTAVSDDDLVAHFAAADAFVFPNELQTWGLAPLEAIAAGTPVVVSRGAGVHEVLEGRDGVQLIEPRHPEQIAAALQRIREAPGEFDVATTREWTRSEFSAQHFAERMAELFTRLQA